MPPLHFRPTCRPGESKRICCNKSIKNALKLKELNPDINVYVLYRDVRAYGLHELDYRKAREQGVIFIRYEEDAKPVVTSENGVGSADLVKQVERGKFPNTQRHFLPRLCNHCEEPACVAACPTKASYRREDGIILIREERCIGCKLCMAACPFDARFLQPDKGIVNKCTFCEHRVDQGVVPACVNTCQGKARAAVEELLRERDLQKAHELFQVQSVRLTERLGAVDRIASDVAQAYAHVESLRKQISSSVSAVERAVRSLQLNRTRIYAKQGLPIEVLQAIQSLETTRRLYLDTVIDYNQAQFRLYTALGQPPSEAIARTPKANKSIAE